MYAYGFYFHFVLLTNIQIRAVIGLFTKILQAGNNKGVCICISNTINENYYITSAKIAFMKWDKRYFNNK